MGLLVPVLIKDFCASTRRRKHSARPRFTFYICAHMCIFVDHQMAEKLTRSFALLLLASPGPVLPLRCFRGLGTLLSHFRSNVSLSTCARLVGSASLHVGAVCIFKGGQFERSPYEIVHSSSLGRRSGHVSVASCF